MHNALRDCRNTDLLIFGLEPRNLDSEFSVGALKVIPDFDLESYLAGYDDDDVGSILQYAVYGQFAPTSGPGSLAFSPMVEDVCVIPFRLFKPDWLLAMTIAPRIEGHHIQVRHKLDITRGLLPQLWAASSRYTLDAEELALVQQKHQQLSALPRGYVEMALRRFSRSYRYLRHSNYAGTSELDDYWVDLVIALESITCRRGERVTADMPRRTARLLAHDASERRRVARKVRDIYDQRCSIVHGEETDKIADAVHEQRFVEAEALRTLVRDVINACIPLLVNPTASLVDSSGRRKGLPGIIDETFQSPSA